MDNKEGKRKMKWQLSNRGERELEWAADGNAVLGGRGGSWWGWRRERRAGPVREWHRCNSLMPQRAFCRGTSQGWDLSSASGWVTGVLQSVEELGWNPPLHGKSLPKLRLAFINFTVQWWFHTLGIWLTKVQKSLGGLNIFCGQLWVPDLQETYERQDSGLEWRHSLRHGHVVHRAQKLHPAAARGCLCHLPSTPDSWGAGTPPGADLETGDQQGSTMLSMGLMKFTPQLHTLKQCWVSKRRGGSRAASWAVRLWSGHSHQPAGAQPWQGPAACASACFLGAKRKSKMPCDKKHV